MTANKKPPGREASGGQGPENDEERQAGFDSDIQSGRKSTPRHEKRQKPKPLPDSIWGSDKSARSAPRCQAEPREHRVTVRFSARELAQVRRGASLKGQEVAVFARESAVSVGRRARPAPLARFVPPPNTRYMFGSMKCNSCDEFPAFNVIETGPHDERKLSALAYCRCGSSQLGEPSAMVENWNELNKWSPY